jgi:hypothetical protein
LASSSVVDAPFRDRRDSGIDSENESETASYSDSDSASVSDSDSVSNSDSDRAGAGENGSETGKQQRQR